MNYVNFNNFQPLNETVYTREEAKTAILMVETKNAAKADKLVADLPESGNSVKSIISLVENKLEMVSALKSAKELLERNAFLIALTEAREAKAKTFEFNGKEYEVFGADVSEEEAIEEKFKYTEDQVNMAYGFYGSLETVYKEAQVQKMFTDAVADLMKAFKISEEVALLVLNAPIGRHTADMLYSKFAATASEGILKYFGGSEAKAKNFINQMHKANEAMNPNIELKEALTSKKPNEVETIELDMAWDSSSFEDDKAAKASFKKYKIKVKAATASFDNGQPGTYEVTGKKKDILAYLQSEFYEMDADTIEEYYPELLEANSNYGTSAGLSKAETKKVAETLAKAISKNDGVKCTVNVKTLEEDSFDLDVDGEEYDGGSYNIYNDGSVRNMAVRGEKYGTTTSTVEDFIKGLKKPVKEAVSEAKLNEALSKEQKMVETFLNKIAKEFDYSIQDAVRFVKETISKMGLDESVTESQSNDIIAALKDIRDFNRGNIDLEHLATSVVKNLGFKTTEKNIENAQDHLRASAGGSDKLPEDKAIVKELYGMLESKVNEAADHEVGMANGQLLDIAKNASELMKKIGETEKDLPGWIQDHISQAQNFLNQANTSYHELEESTELEEAKKYDLGFGSLGNGTTVWNRAKEVRGDYETVAHISVGGNITYYDKTMPADVKKEIEDMAANESFNESAMADIDILAQESKDFKTFVKAFKKEYSNLDAGNFKELESWLQTVYDSAKENMDESAIAEAKKVKFVLYTNPGNSTSAGYVAIGAEDVREVLSDAKRYSDSYKILYQGSGTQADLVKAKNMFSNYSFGNESIDENTDESIIIEGTISPKMANGFKIGNKIKTEKDTYTITGFGSKTNATRDFEAENEKGEQVNLRVSLRGATGIQVAAGKSLNFPEKEEMLESIVIEAKDVKSEVITRLSQFFDVSASALSKFNFDGKDDVRALTKALNGTDYEGVDNIVRIAILSAKRDLGIDESSLTEKDEAVFIEFLNKDKNFKKDIKHFKSYDEAVKWAKANFDKFSPDMIKYESLEIDELKLTSYGVKDLLKAVLNRLDLLPQLGFDKFTDVIHHLKYGDQEEQREIHDKLKELGVNVVYESLEINEKNEVNVSLRHAVQANDIFDDMYRKLGEKESTDVFSFKTKDYANDFIESLIMVGVPKNEIN